jgi:hypothetical protein
MSNYFLGNTQEQVLGDIPKFFYALRRDTEGNLYFARVNQISGEPITINNIGDVDSNYEDFTFGTNYFDGIDEDHEPLKENLKYPQYKWEARDLYYYVNAEGELVVRINQKYTYSNGA